VEVLQNQDQKNHASFLQPAIQTIIKPSMFNIQPLNAVSVIAGPGSYTGLRVGLASAKGLCYALNIPLITLNTLEVMTMAAINSSTHQPISSSTLFCPMIDARRNEVFTAVYNQQLQILMDPSVLILNENSFESFFQHHTVVFFGSGSAKWEAICTNVNMIHCDHVIPMVDAQVQLAYKKYQKRDFANMAYAEPDYLKNVYTSK